MIVPAPSHGFGWLGAASTGAIQTQITQVANQYGVPPALAIAVAQTESSLNPNATGAAGEQGLFQLMPATAAQLGVTDGYDPTQNIQGGVAYLSQLYAQYGDWNTALLAYNAGPGNVAAGTVPASSYSYASSVMANAGMSPTQAALTPAAGTSDGSGDDSGDALAVSTWAWVAGIGVLAAVWAMN